MRDIIEAARGLHPVPAQPFSDAPHCFAAHAKSLGNLRSRSCRRPNPLHLLRAKSSPWVSEALIASSVNHCVLHVRFRCVPSQVHQPVVAADAVAVTGLKAFGSDAHKCFQHQHMNEPPMGLALFAQCQMQVAFRERAWPHLSALEPAQSSARVFDFSRKTLDPSSVADFIEAFKADDRQPAFGGFGR